MNGKATHRPSGKTSEVFPIKDVAILKDMQLTLLAKVEQERYKGSHIALRNLLYFVLSINVGRRGGDTLSLKWGDLLTFAPDGNWTFTTSEYNRIVEEKTHKQAIIICNADVQQTVRFYLERTGIVPVAEELIFRSRKGDKDGKLDVRSMTRIIKELGKECRVPLNLGTHSLRKTFGYHLYKATGDVALVQRMFNHSSPMQTLRYIGIDAETIRDAYFAVEGRTITF